MSGSRARRLFDVKHHADLLPSFPNRPNSQPNAWSAPIKNPGPRRPPPSYNGNGMFLSMGNIGGNHKVGLLFIDFETPHRVRVHGDAHIDREDPLLAEFPGAELLVRVTVQETFINCPRYVHKYQRVQTSKYAPQGGCAPPPPPQWKRIDAMQDVLPKREKGVAEKLGGTITFEEYVAAVSKGEG